MTRGDLLYALKAIYGWSVELISWKETRSILKLEDKDVRVMYDGKKIELGHYFNRWRKDGEAPPSGFVASTVKTELLRQFAINQLFIDQFTPVIDERTKAEYFVSAIPEQTWANCTNGAWMYEFIPSNFIPAVDELCLNTIEHIPSAESSERDKAIDGFIAKHFECIAEKSALCETKIKVFGSSDIIQELIGVIEAFRETVLNDEEYLDILSMCAGVNALEARKAGTNTPLYTSYCYQNVSDRISNEYETAWIIKENVSFDDILLNYDNIKIKYNTGGVGFVPQPGNYVSRTIRRKRSFS